MHFRSLAWAADAPMVLLVVVTLTVESPYTDQIKALTSAGAYYRDTVYLPHFPLTFPHGFVYGFPSAFLFLTVLAQEPRLANFSNNNLMLKIGNASPTLYLVQHLFIIIIIRFVVHGLFPNADKTFDVSSLRQACACRAIQANSPRNRRAAAWRTDDDTPLILELCQRCQVIEQMNAWLDGCKTLLVRFEACLHTWLAFHWLAFSVLLLPEIGRQPTS